MDVAHVRASEIVDEGRMLEESNVSKHKFCSALAQGETIKQKRKSTKRVFLAAG